jgi:lipid A 4'-phosphatase
MGQNDMARRGVLLAVTLLAAGAIFTLWPWLDLWISARFYQPGQGFLLTASSGLERFRNLIWDLSIMVFVVSLAGVGMALVGKPLLRIGARPWGFVALLYALAPGVLVNGLLKRFWGRARPADVAEFGGLHQFTPPFPPADQCTANCSFVSGEVSAAVALSLALLVIFGASRSDWPRWMRNAGMFLAIFLPIAVSAQRIVTGRHFLSDALFAGLFTLVVAWALSGLLSQKPSGHD